MEHELLVGSGIERRRHQDKPERPRERADQAAGHEGDQIGARRDAQRLQIARHRERDAPLDAAAAQPGVDHVLARAVAGDRHMAGRAERREVLQPRAGRMAAPHASASLSA